MNEVEICITHCHRTISGTLDVLGGKKEEKFSTVSENEIKTK